MNLLLKRLLLPALVLAAASAGFIYLKSTRPDPAAAKTDEKRWFVAVERLEPQQLSPTLSLFGRVESPRVARIASPLQADVVEVPVREGEWVELGELLILLDEREQRLAVAQREADLASVEAQIESEKLRHRSNRSALKHQRELLELNRRQVERARNLRAKNLGSQSTLDDALLARERQALSITELEFSLAEHKNQLAQLEAQQRRAEAQRDQAALDLEWTRRLAPFSGRIAAVSVSPGDRVRVGDLLVELFERDSLEIRAQIPSRYLSEVQSALETGVALNARAHLGGEMVEVALARLAARVELGRGGVDGLFRIVEGADRLALGRTVELELALPPRERVYAVPFEAIYGTDRVYRMVEGRMRGINVERIGETRMAGGERRALIRGDELVPGDQLITTQLPNALDGIRVTTELGASAE